MYVLIGAGGHAKVIIDILKLNNQDIKGVIDDNQEKSTFLDYPILGKVKDIPSLIKEDPEILFIISIGSNFIRKEIANKLEGIGASFGTAIHPSAIISSSVEIGNGTVVMPNSIINAGAKIGEHCIINSSSVVEHECELKDFVHISPGAMLAGNVKVGEGTHIGIGASVIQNINIGSNTIVGAGAVIIRDTSDNVKLVGVPAKEV